MIDFKFPSPQDAELNDAQLKSEFQRIALDLLAGIRDIQMTRVIADAASPLLVRAGWEVHSQALSAPNDILLSLSPHRATPPSSRAS